MFSWYNHEGFELFVDEVFLGLEDVDELFEVLELHGVVDVL